MVYAANSWKLFFETVLGSLMMINWLFASRPRVSYCTVEGLSLGRRVSFFSRTLPWTGVVLMLGRFWKSQMPFNILTFLLAMTKFRQACWRLPTVRVVNYEAWTALQGTAKVLTRLYTIDHLLCHKCGTLFLVHGGIRFSSDKHPNTRHECGWSLHFLWQPVRGFICVE